MGPFTMRTTVEVVELRASNKAASAIKTAGHIFIIIFIIVFIIVFIITIIISASISCAVASPAP